MFLTGTNAKYLARKECCIWFLLRREMIRHYFFLELSLLAPWLIIMQNASM